MPTRDYTFLGTTQSLCPLCLELVFAKIISRGQRVYFRKHCPTHGVREDFICSDLNFYDRMEFSLPAKIPAEHGIQPVRGCPYDCGLCTEHEQHTCIGLVEITDACNLTCPLCYASSAPGRKHLSVADACKAIDRLVAVEGRAEVLQISGGEPTIHPEFKEIVRYAMRQPIDYVMINTNGIRLARDTELVDFLAGYRDRMEVYLQLDGLDDRVHRATRGEPLLNDKLAAIEALGLAGLHVTLVMTMQTDVNEDQLGPLLEFAVQRRHITGLSIQPATYSGRHVLPESLERRITFPDVIKGIASQSKGMFREDDFLPLPCAHPNCHSIAIAWRSEAGIVPLTRFIEARKNLDLLANGISFTRPQARNAILSYLGRNGCCSDGCVPKSSDTGLPVLSDCGNDSTSQFFNGILDQQLGAEQLFRITITSFLDAYNFDVRRLMKCCTHHVLPSGHVIPFCAYNVLYRTGHVPLPILAQPKIAPNQSLTANGTRR